MDLLQIISIAIFLIVLIGIISNKFDSTVLALTGAVLMVVFRVIPLNKVTYYISFNTISVLIGMMLIVSIFKKTGFFEYIAILTTKICKGNIFKILLFLGIITALLSGILDNVTTVLLMGPVTFLITKILKVNPIPFVFNEIFASNIGGTGTLIGDPPNIMIGSSAHLSFNSFLIHLFPITFFILIVTILIIYFVYKKELQVKEIHKEKLQNLNPKESIKNKKLLIQGFIVIIFVLLGFIFSNKINLNIGTIAILGACILLLISKEPIENVIMDVEWSSILFFIGLFVLVGGIEQTGVINLISNLLITYGKSNPILLLLITLFGAAIISSFLNNIPFVAALIPLIISLGNKGIDITPLWWAISLGACLGGNGSLIGASANIVLSDISEREGYPISFKDYFKLGFPLMILSIVICSIYLLILYY